MRQFLSFFALAIIFSAVIFASVIFDEFRYEFVALGVIAYGVGFFLDVKSTVMFGRDIVGMLELSPTFRIMSRRYGFLVAIPCQVLTEASLAVLIMFAANYGTNLVTLCACFVLFGGIHMIGWYQNLLVLRKYGQKS